MKNLENMIEGDIREYQTQEKFNEDTNRLNDEEYMFYLFFSTEEKAKKYFEIRFVDKNRPLGKYKIFVVYSHNPYVVYRFK